MLKFNSPKEATMTPAVIKLTDEIKGIVGVSNLKRKPQSMVETGVRALSICTNATAINRHPQHMPVISRHHALKLATAELRLLGIAEGEATSFMEAHLGE
jgi:hypothetical protein